MSVSLARKNQNRKTNQPGSPGGLARYVLAATLHVVPMAAQLLR